MINSSEYQNSSVDGDQIDNFLSKSSINLKGDKSMILQIENEMKLYIPPLNEYETKEKTIEYIDENNDDDNVYIPQVFFFLLRNYKLNFLGK